MSMFMSKDSEAYINSYTDRYIAQNYYKMFGKNNNKIYMKHISEEYCTLHDIIADLDNNNPDRPLCIGYVKDRNKIANGLWIEIIFFSDYDDKKKCMYYHWFKYSYITDSIEAMGQDFHDILLDETYNRKDFTIVDENYAYALNSLIGYIDSHNINDKLDEKINTKKYKKILYL